MLNSIEQIPPYVFTIMGLWSVFWKGLALWTTVKKGRVYWFIAILLLNTVGILPLFYLLYFEKKFLKDFFGKLVKRFR
jgi:hypothetical protein